MKVVLTTKVNGFRQDQEQLVGAGRAELTSKQRVPFVRFGRNINEYNILKGKPH
jgi:hypothetical protein